MHENTYKKGWDVCWTTKSNVHVSLIDIDFIPFVYNSNDKISSNILLFQIHFNQHTHHHIHLTFNGISILLLEIFLKF